MGGFHFVRRRHVMGEIGMSPPFTFPIVYGVRAGSKES